MPAQIWLGHQKNVSADMSEVLWWRTYSPPVWLLDHSSVKTTDLMGMPFSSLRNTLRASLSPDCTIPDSVGLVAPFSSVVLDDLSQEDNGLDLEEVWRYDKHLNLDDLDFAEDGVWATANRVVGRRGLVIWRVKRTCTIAEAGVMQSDW